MRLSEFKEKLNRLERVSFRRTNGEMIPEHFHITEVGVIHKEFIDCGGTMRKEKVVNFQLYTASDYDHRLSVKKLQSIIALSEKALGLGDFEIEVEYQAETIGKYGLSFQNESFQLENKMTDCLATDQCGIPKEKPRLKLSDLAVQQENSCEPGSGCC